MTRIVPVRIVSKTKKNKTSEAHNAVSIPNQKAAGEAEATGQGMAGGGHHGPPLREAFHRGGGEVGAGELGQTEAIGSGGTPRPKLAIHGKFFSQSGSDGIPRRRLAKEEVLAEQRHDGSDHKEGGSGHVGSALVAASSFGCALLLHQRGRHAIGANSGGTQTKTYFCMFYGLGFAAFCQKAHKPNQAQL